MKRRTFDVKDLPKIEKKSSKPRYTAKQDRKSATFNLNLEKAVGSKFINASQQVGYACKLCDVVYSSSSAYLDHINSKMHQIAAGISDIPEQVNLQQVLDRLQYWRDQQLTKKNTEQEIINRIDNYKTERLTKRRRKRIT